MLRAGLQTPVIPLIEVVGSGDSVSPAQIAATGVNVGITLVCPKPINVQTIRNTIKMFFKFPTTNLF